MQEFFSFDDGNCVLQSELPFSMPLAFLHSIIMGYHLRGERTYPHIYQPISGVSLNANSQILAVFF